MVLALFAIESASIQALGAPLVKWWIASSMVKVRPSDSAPGVAVGPAQLYAARNEFAPFQIVLYADQKVADVDVDVTDLRTSQGDSVSRAHVMLYAEQYIDLKVPSSPDGAAGPWPDALVPRTDRYAGERRNAFPMSLQPSRNQPVWVEVYVPIGAAPGEYRGSVRILRHGAIESTIPVQLTVWAFTLPSTATLRSSFGLSGTTILKQHRGEYTSDEELYSFTRLYAKAALLHRISIHGGSMVPPKNRADGSGVDIDWHSYDAEVGPFLNGTVMGRDEPLYGARATSVEVRTPAAFETDEQRSAYMAAWVAHFRQKGWMDRLFLYLWDEPQPGDLPKVAARGRICLRGAPDLQTLVTTPFNPTVRDAVKIWVPLVNCLERRPGFDDYCAQTPAFASYAPEIENGKSLWFYQSCASHGCNSRGNPYFIGWPSYMIDASGPANRVMQWVAWKFHIAGELYYGMNEAYAGHDPWTDIRLSGGNGDGTLFYPGRPSRIGGSTDIPIESIRLKLILEGMEDYEYLSLLARLAGENAAMEYVDRIVHEPYRWESNPETFLRVRQSLGYKLDRLTKARAAHGSNAQ